MSFNRSFTEGDMVRTRIEQLLKVFTNTALLGLCLGYALDSKLEVQMLCGPEA